MRDAREVMAELAATGLSADQVALVMELAAVVAAEARPVQDATAERRRQKDRERKKKVGGIPRKSVESAEQRVSPTPPSEITPIPPLKGGTFPKIPASPLGKPLSSVVAEIWSLTPHPARPRTSKGDIERALKAALRRDHPAEDIVAGIAAYYATEDATKDGGRYAKGAHRLIENDRWQSFEVLPIARPAETDPMPARIRGYRVNGYWHSDWGPKPDAEQAA